MELYTLDSNFLKQDMVENFTSVIWAERLSVPGDVTLVVDPTPENIIKLRKGTLLSLVGSREVMLIETATIKDAGLTITGPSLLDFLKNRWIWGDVAAPTDRHFYMSGAYGTILTDLVERTCINPEVDSTLTGGVNNKITGLFVENFYTEGPILDLVVPFGPLLEAVTGLTQPNQLGVSLYLNDAPLSGDYSLGFKVYDGLDRTSDQDVNPLVRFSSELNSLTGVEEIESISGYKNVAYAITAIDIDPDLAPWYRVGVAYADEDDTVRDFDRRVIVVEQEDLTRTSYDSEVGGEDILGDILEQRARDALANNNFTKVVDGEIVPQSDYQYGVNYNMGDIIELQGRSGIIQKARVTEYIRSQDENGEKAYPTVSVVD